MDELYREKVIKGLEQCADTGKCQDCAYGKEHPALSCKALLKDALELIRSARLVHTEHAVYSGIRMFKELPPSKEDELREKVKCFKVVRKTYWEESKRFLETHTMNHPLYKLSWEDEKEYDKITSVVKELGDKIKEMEDELNKLQEEKICKE